MFWLFALALIAIALAFGLGYSQAELDRIKNPDGREKKPTTTKTKEATPNVRLLDV